MQKELRKKTIFISVSLLASLLIYLFYRTERTVVNSIAIRLISHETFTDLRRHVANTLPLNNIIVYSLPEGLWIFCITLTSKSHYLVLYNRRIDCLYLPILFCVTLEIFQLVHITNGRFDFMDIAVSIIFWLLGSYTLRDGQCKQNIIARPNVKSIVCWSSYCIVYLAHVVK